MDGTGPAAGGTRLTEEIFRVTYQQPHHERGCERKGDSEQFSAMPRTLWNVPGLFNAIPEVVNDYLRLFVNRRAYTLQSMHPPGERTSLLLQTDQQENRRG